MNPGGRWRATLALAATVLVLLLLLPQRTLHGVDGEVFVSWIEQGRHDYPRHVAYLHLVGAIHSLCAPLGMSAFGSLLLASALGSALAVLCIHRAFLLLLPAPMRSSIAPALAVAATAPFLFYATCAEIHGVFVAGAGAAWWAFARYLREPSAGRAAVVGLLTGAAAAVHAYGHVLLPSMVLMAAVTRTQAVGARLLHAPTAVAVHASVAIGLAWLLGAGACGQVDDILRFTREQWRVLAPATTPDVLVREWLWPYAPWSLAAIIGLWSTAARPWAQATLVGLLLHLPFTVLLLGYHRIDEGGAYQLALLPAAVLSAALLLRPREFWAATLVAALLALHGAAPQWPEPAAPGFVAAVDELNTERPVTLIVGRRHELDGVRTGVRDLIVIDLGAALNLWLEQRARGVSLSAWFDGWFARFERSGRPLLLSASAHEFFADNPDPEVRAFWDRHVPGNYLIVPERRSGFSGVWVLPGHRNEARAGN